MLLMASIRTCKSEVGWCAPCWGLLILLAGNVSRTSVHGADWNQWRANPGRTASTDEVLDGKLHLQWVRQLPNPQSVWPKYPRLNFSETYEPVVSNGLIFVPSMIDGSVSALDVDSGVVKWKYYTDGPVRLAPLVYSSNVYVASDDGYVHCIRALDGEFLWKHRGASKEFKERWLLGNDQLCSLWPVRGGPVISDGILYFAAGVWPNEGIVVRAIDATTGNLVWMNEEVGSIAGALDDHGGKWDGGLSPQGYLVALGEKLIVPCGRAMAAVLDRQTGKMEPYTTHWGGRRNLQKGTWFVTGTESYFYVGGDLYDLSNRRRIASDPVNSFKELGEYREPVLENGMMYASLPINEKSGYRPRGAGYERVEAWDLADHRSPKLRWKLDCDLKVHCKAGNRLFAAAGGNIAAIDLPVSDDDEPVISWRGKIDGQISRLLVANGRLCGVTKDGKLFAFGAEETQEPAMHRLPNRKEGDGAWQRIAAEVLEVAEQKHGHCVVLGNGPLAIELARQSDLRVCVIEPDRSKANELRSYLDECNMHWPSITVRCTSASATSTLFRISRRLGRRNAQR